MISFIRSFNAWNCPSLGSVQNKAWTRMKLIITLKATQNSTGQHKVQARLLEFRDSQVVLEKEDGQTVTLPLEKLSRGDQAYVRRRTNR